MKRFAFALAALTVVALACGGADPKQSSECVAYAECYRKIGGTGTPTYDPDFGAMPCAKGETAACINNCKALLTTIKTAYPDAGCN